MIKLLIPILKEAHILDRIALNDALDFFDSDGYIHTVYFDFIELVLEDNSIVVVNKRRDKEILLND